MSDLFDYNIWPGPYDETVPPSEQGAILPPKPKSISVPSTPPITMPGSPVLTGRPGESPDKPLSIRPTSVTTGEIGLRNGFKMAGVVIEGRVPNRSLLVHVGDYVKIPLVGGLGGMSADTVYTVVETSLTSDPGGYTDYQLTIRPHV